mmetsp:Transcript_22704/g.33524  ORF Transcript_22704/g.33524 Transcript_22704/m.33524 type:complete len:106 (+) Transcript_22704:77-394(+)|eukprot:CAMPEP_0194253202 /NCGR_PEP_ID=MMETSP0158-20130606/29449_1 /TAXON_ID=33649 /ORGANISM="Thalassionema nitzschioides, Strain L26-B" /LENGTH=105 /DNA_ID=CAMNT_0038990837 /DNA_START=24 /DNA_END=341 /DNA_ORIENTATION=-
MKRALLCLLFAAVVVMATDSHLRGGTTEDSNPRKLNHLDQTCLDDCTHGAWLNAEGTCQNAALKYDKNFTECMETVNSWATQRGMTAFCTQICDNPHDTDLHINY